VPQEVQRLLREELAAGRAPEAGGGS